MRFSSALWKTSSRVVCVCLLGAPLAFAAPATPATSTANEGESDDHGPLAILGALQARYEGITDLRAEFVQEAHIASLGKRDLSRGHVVVQRPGRMRWEYVAPERRVIVLDGDTLRVYTPADAQLQIAGLAGGFSPTALGFLLGKGDLRADFTSELLVQEERPEIGLRLRPRGDAAFEHLEMWLAPDSHQLRESVVVDVFGNRTSVRFTKIAENGGVDDAAFEIRVPDGTEVIDLR